MHSGCAEATRESLHLHPQRVGSVTATGRGRPVRSPPSGTDQPLQDLADDQVDHGADAPVHQDVLDLGTVLERPPCPPSNVLSSPRMLTLSAASMKNFDHRVVAVEVQDDEERADREEHRADDGDQPDRRGDRVADLERTSPVVGDDGGPDFAVACSLASPSDACSRAQPCSLASVRRCYRRVTDGGPPRAVTEERPTQEPVNVALPGPFSMKDFIPISRSCVAKSAANCCRSISRPGVEVDAEPPVDRLLGRAYGERGCAAELPRPGDGLGVDLVGREQPVDQPDLQRLVGLDEAPGEDQVLGLARTDQPAQPLGAAGARDDPEQDLRLAERRVVGGEPDVRAQRELAPATEGVAGDRGDDRLRDPGDRGEGGLQPPRRLTMSG